MQAQVKLGENEKIRGCDQTMFCFALWVAVVLVLVAVVIVVLIVWIIL
jgi:hypothetical protein